MLSSPIITVICPVHNAQKYLPQTLDSILNQSFENFELVIVDDGSVDRSSEQIDSYLRRDNRIVCLKTVTRGVACARNFGLLSARGPYIAFIDSDDTWEPLFLEMTHRILSKNPRMAGVFCWSWLMDKKGRRRGSLQSSPGVKSPMDMLVELCPPKNCSSLLIRKEALLQAGGFASLPTNQDVDLWFRMVFEHHFRFECIPSFLVNYRIHPSTMTTQTKKHASIILSERIERYLKYLSPAQQHFVRSKHLSFFATKYLPVVFPYHKFLIKQASDALRDFHYQKPLPYWCYRYGGIVGLQFAYIAELIFNGQWRELTRLLVGAHLMLVNGRFRRPTLSP